MHKERGLSVGKILKRELHSAGHVFHDYFIPHAGNNHKPHILHEHHAKALAGILLGTKVCLVIILFSFVPHIGQLSPQIESAMVDLTNNYRAQLKESALTRNSYLDSVAQLRAADMFQKNYFSHYAPDGRKPWEWVNTAKYNYSRFGENLAMDFVTADAVFKAFIASPSHEKNLRNQYYQDIGVAMASGMIDGRETNLMVVLFATPKVVTTPKIAVTPPVVAQEKPVPAVKQPVKVTVKPTPQPIQPVIDKTTAPSEQITSQPLALNQPLEVKGVEVQPQPVTPLEVSPNVSNGEIKPVVITHSGNWVEQLVFYSDDLYFLLLIAFIVIALLNIIVSFRVQHRSAIIASFILILLAGYLWLVDWSAVEGLASGVTVLGWTL